MCGIAGIVSLGGPPATLDALERMCASLVHRGPDDQGMGLSPDGRVALGMRRLAIIDVAGGQQPIANEDGTVVTVYNGEIYNYRELRRELEATGHSFRTESDTEVIVHLWEEHGPDFVDRLNGMFALALHDRRQGLVLLARDHLGIKPLFFAEAGGQLLFASEVKAILAAGPLERRLDVDALRQFLSWEYVPAPRTLLHGVEKLEPGHLLTLDLADGAVAKRRYWDVPLPHAPGDPRADAAWEEALAAKLDGAVKAQLMSEVPLGVLLSGGVDSSLVASAMPRHKAVSIGFDEKSYNELAFAKRVAAHLGHDHEAEIIRPSVASLFDRLMEQMDDPIADFSIFPTFLVCQLARRHVTVALAGDGGDELFAGYETFLAERLAKRFDRVPGVLRRGVISPLAHALPPAEAKKGTVNKIKRFVAGAELDPVMSHARWRLFLTEAQSRALFTPDALRQAPTPLSAHIETLRAEAGARSELSRQLYVDLKSYLTDNCLTKVDRMSMAVSLEARVPMLDKELVSLAFAMPDHLKLGDDGLKSILKRIAAQRVPRGCVYRQKQGFSMPMKDWLKSEFRPLMEDLLSPTRVAADGLFQADFVEQLKREHLAGRQNHSHALWALMVFQDWRQRWAV